MTAVETKSKRSSYGSIIRSAIKGEDFDYTAIPIRKAIVLLAIPMMLELILESVFAVVDIFFVNKLGIYAVSTVGLTESVVTIVYSVGIGLSSAATAMVARRVGEKNLDDAAKAGAQSILLAIISSLALGIPGFIFAPDVLRLMGAEPEAIAIGTTYCRIMLGGNVVIILLFLINGIFRGAGDASIAMKSLWIGNILNIILDPLLIFGIGIFPELGVTGAAIATTSGRALAVIYQMYHLSKAKGVVKIKWHHFKPDRKVIKGLIAIASPATLQFVIASASWIILAAMVAKYGSEASAGYQTAVRLVIFFILPAWGMSNAAATLVGQNLGAKFPERAEQSVMIASRCNAIFMAFVTFIFMVFAHPLVGLFIPDTEAEQIRYAVLSLQIISSGYIFYGVGMVAAAAFNGAGDSKTPTWIYFFGFWLFQIPLAFVLNTYTALGITGILIVIPVAETLIAIAAYLLFKKGKWKTVIV